MVKFNTMNTWWLLTTTSLFTVANGWTGQEDKIPRTVSPGSALTIVYNHGL